MRFVVLMAVVCGGLAPTAIAAPPTLSHLFPAGGQRGSKATITLSGKFDWPVNVWAPGLEVAAGAESGKLDVTIPADLPADRVWLRLHNAEGASVLVPFLIGQLPEITEQEPNNASKEAQAIAESSVTINGALARADVDGFMVSLAAGQTLVAAVHANTRLGSPMDAILQVASPNGTVLAENHDALGLDPRIVFTAVQTGPHIVRLFAFPAAPDSTIAFRGGDDYIYRLTVTTGPFVSHAAPLAVTATEPGLVRLHGWNLPAELTAPIQPFGGERLAGFAELEPFGEIRASSEVRLGFAFSPEFAGAARVRLVSHAVVRDIPQSDAEHPLVITPPIAVTGCLQSPRQRDVYHIPLSKGQPVLITVDADELGFPVDPVLLLTDPAGNTAAEADDTGKHRDAALAHTPEQDGVYRLTVSDRYRHGSPRSFYRLTVRPEQPDFELTASADAIVIPAGKSAELPVNVVRRNVPGQDVGPITVTAVDLPEGVTIAEAVSEPKGPTAGKVTLTFSSSGSGSSGPIRLIGTAREPAEIVRGVRTPARLGAAWETVWLTAIASPPPQEAEGAQSPR